MSNYSLYTLRREVKEIAVIGRMHTNDARRAQSRADRRQVSGRGHPAEHQRARSAQSLAADVRSEARHLQLAYGFIRGRDYETIENSVREGNDPNPVLMHYILQEVGEYYTVTELEDWLFGVAMEPEETEEGSLQNDPYFSPDFHRIAAKGSNDSDVSSLEQFGDELVTELED